MKPVWTGFQVLKKKTRIYKLESKILLFLKHFETNEASMDGVFEEENEAIGYSRSCSEFFFC